MKAEYINSFYKATKDVLKLMLDLDIEMDKPEVAQGMVSSQDTNVILGVTGDLRGNILFGFPEDMTLEMVRIMSGMQINRVDEFVSSALGEVANIIGGNAITLLASHEYICDIVPPQIFIGQYKSMSMANKKAICLPLKSEIGEFSIIIYLTEE